MLPYALAAVAIAATAGKDGSSLNYLLELSAALALAAGFLVAALESRPRLQLTTLIAVLVQAALLLLITAPYFALTTGRTDDVAAEQTLAKLVVRPAGRSSPTRTPGSCRSPADPSSSGPSSSVSSSTPDDGTDTPAVGDRASPVRTDPDLQDPGHSGRAVSLDAGDARRDRSGLRRQGVGRSQLRDDARVRPPRVGRMAWGAWSATLTARAIERSVLVGSIGAVR